MPLPVGLSASLPEALARGRDALARGAWEQARAWFEAALQENPTADAYEGLSWCGWWLGDGDLVLEARERAYRLYRERGDLRGAARMATWIADDHIDFRGERAVARGWFARAERMLEDLEMCPEHGWLAALQAQRALEEGDTETARRLGIRAREAGTAAGLTALEMHGLATEGLALVMEGEVERGMRGLDEAVAAALGGEYEDFVPVCWTCCYLIYACENVRDYDRAAQWCKKVEEVAARMRVRFIDGVCRAHYAAVLTWHGDWTGAEKVLLEARDALAASRPVWVPEATVRLAELRRRQGRVDEAERLFAEADPHPLAVLGAAELSLDRRAGRDAVLLAGRLLRHLTDENKTTRAAAVELLVRAHCGGGERDEARARLEELRGVVEAVATGPLRAALTFCEGLVARMGGDLTAARALLEDAATLYQIERAPFEAGRARLELARCLAELGERRAAQQEAEAAHVQLRELGAEGEAARAREFLEGWTKQRRGPLTPRELEVLRLVSDGLTDAEIAAELMLSHHTVHRHVSNIYAKLGCSSRAAAVATATRLELL